MTAATDLATTSHGVPALPQGAPHVDCEVLALPDDVEVLEDNSQYTNRFNFTSASGRRYLVAQRKFNPSTGKGGWWACDCPSFTTRRKDSATGKCCKHMAALGLPGNHQPFFVGKLLPGGGNDPDPRRPPHQRQSRCPDRRTAQGSARACRRFPAGLRPHRQDLRRQGRLEGPGWPLERLPQVLGHAQPGRLQRSPRASQGRLQTPGRPRCRPAACPSRPASSPP